ncbi:hypothetical protein DSM3645_05390 [Blastopirellula marina DSM 3645]|uniref:Uncharacterized protein n=1 Tax=Blastopirellula marina DSM 3645 TaxID=314230 RepID=A3ZTX2_9BACT|nr:hypothetical protein DSM3645_05390 [Blastopirellula marina DSM 3645]
MLEKTRSTAFCCAVGKTWMARPDCSIFAAVVIATLGFANRDEASIGRKSTRMASHLAKAPRPVLNQLPERSNGD